MEWADIKWANVEIHGLGVRRHQSRRRCGFCAKGARKRVTHALVSNGLVMGEGCEWHAYRELRSSHEPMKNPYRQREGLDR